jgi:hypothetical protein
MRQNKKSRSNKPPTTVHRAIAEAPVPPPQPRPGDIGQAAIAAATLHQLNRYAQDIQQYLNTSKMRALLNRVQADMELDPIPQPRMRLRKD